MKETPEDRTKRFKQICEKADMDLAIALRRYTVSELLHDWECNLHAGTREILRREFTRRGMALPPKAQRGE